MRALVVCLLFGSAFCGSFKWDPIVVVPYATSGAVLKIESTSDGVHHIIGQQYNKTFVGFIYHMLYPNGTLMSKEIILGGKNRPYDCISLQISDDGKHILLAYEGTRDGSDNPHYIMEIFFIESFNGGKDWSRPIKMPRKDMNDAVNRNKPSILLEKDTGRVYIGYIHGDIHATIRDHHVAISIREPGKTSFESEFIASGTFYAFSVSLGYTVDRSASKRYLHMFWTTEDEGLHYTHSTDNGNTWTRGISIGDGNSLKTPTPIGINTRIAEGTIYAQYANNDVLVAWSKDHGNTMENQIKVYSGSMNRHSLGICGTSGRGIVVSADVKHGYTFGYIGFMPINSRKFTSLTYPFETLNPAEIRYPEVACSYLGNDKYSIVFVVENRSRRFTYLAHGTLNIN